MKYHQPIKLGIVQDLSRRKRRKPKKPIHIVSGPKRCLVPTEKKYLVIGGTVRSQHDDQYHYISPPRLCELYGVEMAECIMVWDKLNMPVGLDPRLRLIILRPRRDGDYTLPNSKEVVS